MVNAVASLGTIVATFLFDERGEEPMMLSQNEHTATLHPPSEKQTKGNQPN